MCLLWYFLINNRSHVADFHTQNLFISRDVLFIEHIFPLKIVIPLSKTFDTSLDSFAPFHSTSSVCDPYLDLMVPMLPLVAIVHPQVFDSLPVSNSSASNFGFSSHSFAHSFSHSPDPPLEVRRSIRHRYAPSYLQDYDCGINLVFSPCSLSKVLSYDQLSPDHKSFVKVVGVIEEPRHYHEVARNLEWQHAI